MSNDQITLDVVTATGTSIYLSEGTYWLSAFPSMAFGAYGQWFWDVSTTANGSTGQVIDPYNLLGNGWTSWTPWTTIDPTYVEAAFRLEGQSVTPMVVVDVTFDASVPDVDQPGEYNATLQVDTDTPYGAVDVPVTMFVTIPPSWGKLQGTVTGLGYCDANPAPLEAHRWSSRIPAG